MPIFTSAVVTPTQGSLETAITAYADANSAANTVAVYANSNVILNSANLNFNNTDSISVSVTPNTVNQANIAFSVRNRLGIGTNNPSANLHVIGNTLITTDLTVAGNLFVEGNTTTLNVQTLEVEDNDIVLNANTTGSPTLNATITIDRGTSTNTFLRWNEVTDRWGWSDNGTTFEAFEDLVKVSGDTMTGSLNVTAGGVNISAGGLAVTGGANVVSGGVAVTGGATISGNTNLDSGTLFVDSVNDRVGIGTINPGAKFDVSAGNIVLSGSSTADQFIRIGSSRTGNGYSYLDLQGDTTYSNGLRIIRGNAGPNSVSNIEHRGTSPFQFVTQEAAPIDFYTNGANFRMRIDSSGNVGIGTGSPGALLHVSNASAKVRIGLTASDQYTDISRDNATGYTIYNAAQAATFRGHIFQLGGTEAFRIDSSGNVGIGTASPASKLSVSNSASVQIQATTGTVDFRLQSIDANSAGYSGTVSNHAYVLTTNNAERMRIDSSGNVGIGTATPSSYGKFAVVAGNTYFYVASSGFWSSVFGPRSAGDGFCSVGMYYNNSGGYWKFDSASGAFTFYENGTLRASISNTGQLQSYATTGTAPLVVASTTAVANLNADMVDGYHGSTLVQTSNNSAQTTLWNPYGDYYTTVWSVGNDFNNFVNSGSYHVDNAASNHASAGSYGYLRIWRHIGSNYLLQEFTPSGSAVSTWRRLGQDNGAGSRIWTGWSKYWSDGNDGAGSGLDADLLDGAQGSSYLRSDQSATNSVDLRSPNFYISADTNNRFGQGLLILRNSAPTVYFQDTDNNSAMLHNNSNLLYVLRGGNDTTSWSQVGGQWPFIFNLSNNDATCGGSFAAIGNVTAYSSDRRLKTNIQNIPNALNKVLSLNGVTFDWVDKVKELGFTPDTMTNDAGVIAQEVQEVLPQAVKPAPFDHQWNNDKNNYVSKSGEEFVTVQYEKLVPLLIEAIKELKKEIEDLKLNRNV